MTQAVKLARQLLEQEDEEDEGTRDGLSAEVGSGDILEDEEVDQEDDISQDPSNAPNL